MNSSRKTAWFCKRCKRPLEFDLSRKSVHEDTVTAVVKGEARVVHDQCAGEVAPSSRRQAA